MSEAKKAEEERKAALTETLTGIKAQLIALTRTVTETIDLVNAAPEVEVRERPRTFGRREES